MVRVGQVTKTLVKMAVEEIKADMLFVGTANVGGKSFFMLEKDPIVHHLVDNCPVTLCLVRHDVGESLDDG